MKEESMSLTDGDPATESSVVKESAMMPGVGEVISGRASKPHLSALLEEVACDREVVITTGGQPKASLVAPDWRMGQRPFSGTEEHLKRMPPWRGGMTSEEIIREDRDSRD